MRILITRYVSDLPLPPLLLSHDILPPLAPILVHQPQVLSNPVFGPPAQHHFDTVHNYPYTQQNVGSLEGSVESTKPVGYQVLDYHFEKVGKGERGEKVAIGELQHNAYINTRIRPVRLQYALSYPELPEENAEHRSLLNKHGEVIKQIQPDEEESEEPYDYDDDIYNPLDSFIPFNNDNTQPNHDNPIEIGQATFWPFGQRRFSVNVPVNSPTAVYSAEQPAGQSGGQEVKTEKMEQGNILDDLKSLFFYLPNKGQEGDACTDCTGPLVVQCTQAEDPEQSFDGEEILTVPKCNLVPNSTIQ
ncbi:uncharacterized protein LOC111704813 [Eurytemora carolleeae]|uniref:uncharacterized protein LOC111704813 n=1 Tax=Eurytemora carolleeae TaxID=1294199 RepID=UPI000C763A45|nr:uncharacterized protein LOC111704813 [Eurytemora carolleeae]|eukprot:XP_023332931.1 uncharacterized protein LOC111704813 [Eurytemora affinis]